jgi:hypothetical protein
MGSVYTSTGAAVTLTKAGWSGISLGGIYLDRSGSGGGGTSPASQQSFPTSAYGQTVPVIWGKARVPGAYIWAPDIIVRTTTTGAILQTTTVSVLLSARIRFARPLVADSTWSLRRLWADGVLILDNSTGYRKSGLNVRFYDGRSTQGRDPHMVSKEGTSNVSAHRGYLDIVLNSYNLGTAAVAPPAFEAELVQDATSSTDIDAFTGFFGDDINTHPAADWENGEFYGISTSIGYLRRFNIGTVQEVYAIPMTGVLSAIEENSLRYIPEMDRLVGVDYVPGIGNGAYPCVIDPTTGAVLDHGAAMAQAGNFTNTLCAFAFSQTVGALIAVSFSAYKVSTYTFGPDSMTQTWASDTNFDGRGEVQCITVGEVRDSDADVYLCTNTTIYKARLTSNGFLLGIESFATDTDDFVYAVYHDEDIIAWTDAGEAIRFDGATGATVWTASVPYQIETGAVNRGVGTPDQLRLDGVFYLQENVRYNFTDLDTGVTTEIVKTSSSPENYVYDGVNKVAVTTDNTTDIAVRTTFDAVGSGTTRDLEDFIADVWEATGFESTEHTETNIDDQIQGAVIDITTGGREIVRTVAGPYSIGIFERSGKIITKRPLTDGLFAVDAAISSTDIADKGGQAVRARRLNPEEFVAHYWINYRDPDEIYQSRPQSGDIPALPLPVAPTDMSYRADVPIIMDGDTIKVLATKKVNKLAVEKHEFELTLRAKFCDLEPEDIIQFTYAGRSVTARVLEATMHPDFTIDVKATEFLTSVSVSISGGTGRPVEPEEVGTAPSKYYHLDIPLMEDTHDTAGGSLVQYHVLASTGQLTWDGATLFRKDAAGTYIPQISQAENGVVGIALTLLPDWDIPYVTELTREITVAIISGDTDLLTSATYQEVCEGANRFAIGQPGRWEICHVIDITDNGDNTFTFTGLRRGRGTSEEFTGDHAIGDFVVWLEDDNVQRLEYTIASLNDAFDYKPVGFGGTLAGTITVNRTVTGEAEKIPKPAFVDIGRVSTNIVIDWVRRSRIGSYWADDGDDTYTTPLGESLEQYVIRIKSGPSGSILRTITVDDATTYNYSDANQTTDFGSTVDAGESLTLDIRQVSGTGVVCPTREVTVTL